MIITVIAALLAARRLLGCQFSPFEGEPNASERTVALLACAGLRVLAWVAHDGHCFFGSLAAVLTLRGTSINALGVRQAIVTAMRGPNVAFYKNIWANEYMISTYSPAFETLWDTYLTDIGSNKPCAPGPGIGAGRGGGGGGKLYLYDASFYPAKEAYRMTMALIRFDVDLSRV